MSDVKSSSKFWSVFWGFVSFLKLCAFSVLLASSLISFVILCMTYEMLENYIQAQPQESSTRLELTDEIFEFKPAATEAEEKKWTPNTVLPDPN